MTHLSKTRHAALFVGALIFAGTAVQAAGGGAATLGQSTGPGASAPGMAASDPPKARSGKAHRPRKAASGTQQGNSSNREHPGGPRSAASAP